jgi:hypothetical protein
VIDLGYCLDLFDYQNLLMLKNAYRALLKLNACFKMPENKTVGSTGDLLLRELDCSVIEILHLLKQKNGQPPFDSVRSVFYEGDELYPNAGFREKDHVQICIRNPNCIKGFFLPRELDSGFPKV